LRLYFKYNAYQREYQQNLRINDVEKAKSVRRRYCAKKKYGLTLERYDDLVAQPHCTICGDLFEDDSKPHLDHCHSTGKVRGVLCSRCNVGLGHFKDNTESLQTAIEYLSS